MNERKSGLLSGGLDGREIFDQRFWILRRRVRQTDAVVETENALVRRGQPIALLTRRRRTLDENVE